MAEKTRLRRLLAALFVSVAVAACSGGGGNGNPDAGNDAGVDPASDPDGDGLTNAQEEAGWDIQVDRAGLGTKTTEHVTSDPTLADTDGDGLTDAEEFQKTSPRSTDTDGDTLSDRDEVRVYLSIATTVDSDGDSVSGSTSNTQLWDGDEVKVWGTSPSLTDTDGDARSDYEEVINNATNPLVAQVPEVELSFAGQMDVRLNVEYSQSAGGTREYGRSLLLAETTEQSRTDSFSSTLTAEASVTVGVEATAGFPESSVTASASATASVGYSQENATSLATGQSQTAQQEYREYQTDSQTFTETASSGTLSIGMRLKNRSSVAYTLTNISGTVFQWDRSTQSFKTLATLTPALSSFTLAPNEEKPVPQQVQATGVNAALIKEFLRQPSSLYFRVSNFDVENAEGLNFAFLDEVTSARTGLVVIDFGDGRVKRYRVATNVRRNPDGSPAGVTMRDVLEKYLKNEGLSYETMAWHATGGTTEFPQKEGTRVLVRLGDKSTEPAGSERRRFWAVFSSVPRLGDRSVDFEDMVLQRGESIHLAYVSDDDRDGLFSREEFLHGSSDLLVDTDTDGLTDVEEVRTGWTAGTGLPGGTGYPRKVFSDPSRADTDGDGLIDPLELQKGTDPHNPDTDDDGLNDLTDASPLDPVNPPPTINLTLTSSAPNFTLAGTVTDSADAIANVTVSWGDGSANTQITSSFDNIHVNHAYASSGTYTITVTATDVRDASSVRTYTAENPFPTVGLLAHYRLNGSFNDASSNNRHLTLERLGSTSGHVTDRAGNAGWAFSFKDDLDTPDYAYAYGSLSTSIGAGDFSVAFWVKPAGSGNQAGYLVSHQGSFYTRLEDGKPRIELGTNGEGAAVMDDVALATGTWKFLAFTKSGSTVTLYVDGAQVHQAQVPAYTSTACGALWLNGYRYSSTCTPEQDASLMAHALDDVRVFSRALSAEEVGLLENAAP